VLWYVPENLDAWGVAVPASWEEFLALCPTLQGQGVTPWVCCGRRNRTDFRGDWPWALKKHVEIGLVANFPRSIDYDSVY
jgi:hypothetical protein